MDKFLTATNFVPRVERSAAYTQTVAPFPTIINDFYNSVIDSMNCGVNIKSPFGLIPSKKIEPGPMQLQ